MSRRSSYRSPLLDTAFHIQRQRWVSLLPPGATLTKGSLKSQALFRPGMLALATILLVAILAHRLHRRLLEKQRGGVTTRGRLMAGDALNLHISVVRIVVKGLRAGLRLPAIGMAFKAAPVSEGKPQMIWILEAAHEIPHRIPAGDGLDDELVGERRPDVAVDTLDLPLMGMGTSECDQLRGIGHKVLED